MSFNTDSMAFVGQQGQAPNFTMAGRPQLAIAHLTSCSPTQQFFDYETALGAHRAFRCIATTNRNTTTIRTQGDVPFVADQKVHLLFDFQHAPRGLTLSRIHELADEGLRVLSLAHAGPSEYGHGFQCPNGGLTDRGKDLIRMLNDCGNILLDLSHANVTTVSEAIELIRREGLGLLPMASHSGCTAVHQHPRNLTDDCLLGLADLGGYVGIPAITFLIATQGADYLAQWVRHIKHAIVCCGTESVGIGSDCNHIAMTMEAAQKHFDDMRQMLGSNGSFGEYFPDRPQELIEKGNVMFQILRGALRLEQMSQFDTDRIAGESFASYLRDALPRT